MDRDIDREDEEAAPVEGVPLRARLKVVAHYALLASPVLALLALGLAVAALVLGRAAPPDDSAARIESLSRSLTETRNELENLKFTLGREKSVRAEERKKAEEREAAIVRNVTQVQTKLKVSPTLEDQLKVTASAPAVVSASSAVSPATTAAASAPVPVAADTEKKPVPVPAAPSVAAKKPAASAPVKTDKTPTQVNALKEAIEKFNKK